jgi:hypothetical protein
VTEIVGFSGTRAGMTPQQMSAVKDLLREFKPATVHHGMCIGADCEFEALAREVLTITPRVIGHPGVNQKGEAASRGSCSPDEVLPERGYSERDRDIVLASDVLIAAPKQDRRAPRSGTWLTIQWAENYGRPRFLVLRDGSVIR